MHSGVPDATEPDPVALVEVADDAALVAEVLALEAPDAELGEAAVDVDDAAHPAVSTPAASSGMASSAFFTRSPNAYRTDGASVSVITDLYDTAAPFPVGPHFSPDWAEPGSQVAAPPLRQPSPDAGASSRIRAASHASQVFYQHGS